MNKKSGFTLIEILAVVTIIGLIFILVIPKITNSLKNKKSDVDSTTNNIVIAATKLYVSDHSSKFEKIDGNVSCMPIHQLVKKGYLDAPVKNVTDDEDITNSMSVKITYDKGFKYEIVNKRECKIYYCKSDYCDNEGNGYTEVDYIESTGTQYIDTGVYADYNTGALMKVYPIETSSSNRQVYLGSYDGNNYYFGKGSVGNYNLIYSFFDNSYQYNYNFSEYLSEKIVYINKNYIKVNDSEASLSGTTKKSTLTTYIFARHNSDGPVLNALLKLYYLKMYDDNNLIRDYVPVIDSSERPCLFDKVEKKCYYNQGEGEFIVGYSDKFNQQYRPINYIESTGTQYIDTEIYPDYDTGFFIKIYPTEIQSPQPAQVYLGSYDGNNYYFGKGNGNNYNLIYQFFDSNYAFPYNSSEYSSEKIVYANKNYIYLNGIEPTLSNTTKTSTLSMYVFARHNNDGPVLNALLKLYYLRIYDDNNLVRDYIPVLDANDRPCLYDKVSKTCYYNQGTGEFLYG